MVIHSVAPLSMLIPEAPVRPCEIRRFEGGFLEGQQDPDGFRISRLISTDPMLYLDPKYAPGQLLGLPFDNSQAQ